MHAVVVIAAVGAVALVGAAWAQMSGGAKPAAVDRLMQGGFKSAAPEWQARLVQDETQKACSNAGSGGSAAVIAAVRRREKARIVYPADGVLMGDWKKGAALAQSGYGGRYTDFPPREPNGGNCYACHQLDKNEVSYGTLGPSLVAYGRIRKFGAPFEKAVYEHIYNPQASQPCAQMPRFGTNKVLSIEQIKDLVAYVMSPDSPVNK